MKKNLSCKNTPVELEIYMRVTSSCKVVQVYPISQPQASYKLQDYTSKLQNQPRLKTLIQQSLHKGQASSSSFILDKQRYKVRILPLENHEVLLILNNQSHYRKSSIQNLSEEPQDNRWSLIAECQKLISQISTRLIKVSIQETDQVLNDAIEEVGHFLDFDAGTIYFYDQENKLFIANQQWHKQTCQGLLPERFQLRHFSRAIDQLQHDSLFYFTKLSDLPPESMERKLFHGAGSEAAIGVSLFFENQFIGLMLLSKRAPTIPFVEELTPLLKMLAEAFANAIVHKKDKLRLEESKEQFRHLYENNPSMYFTLSTEGKILAVNKFGQKQLACKECNYTGKPFQELIHKEDRATFTEFLQKLHQQSVEGEPVLSDDFRQHKKTGETFWTQAWGHLTKRANGDEVILLVCEDITIRKQAEQDLESRADDLIRSNLQLERFAYIASHDLKEPLRMVASYVQLLEKRYAHQLDAKAGEYVSYAVNGAKRMYALLEGLLELSKVDARIEPFRKVHVDQIIDIILDKYRDIIEKRDVQIYTDDLPMVLSDQTLLVQVIQNLVDNAIKFSHEERPKIWIHCQREASAWQFSVSDHGIGFHQDYADQVFEPFQRLHDRAIYPGTGIGLAITKKIIDMHGGQIWVDAEENKGATFYFTLPILKA